jgi:hypothetical protein
MVTPVAAGPARETIRSRRTARGWAGAKKSFRRHWQLYLLMVPSLVYFAVFKYIPMANNVIAFKNYNVVDGVWGSEWVGFDQFDRLFANPQFWTLVKNTFLLSGYVVLASFPFPIILALALNEVRNRFFKRTGADGHLRAVLHLDRRRGLDDDPLPLAAAGPDERCDLVLRHGHGRLPERSGLLPAHLRRD